MSVTLTTCACGQRLYVKEENTGQQVQCPACRQFLYVPLQRASSRPAGPEPGTPSQPAVAAPPASPVPTAAPDVSAAPSSNDGGTAWWQAPHVWIVLGIILIKIVFAFGWLGADNDDIRPPFARPQPVLGRVPLIRDPGPEDLDRGAVPITIAFEEAGHVHQARQHRNEVTERTTRFANGGPAQSVRVQGAVVHIDYEDVVLNDLGRRRRYERYRVTENGKENTVALEGQTVLIKRRGDREIFRFEGGGHVPRNLAGDLEREFNSEFLFILDRIITLGPIFPNPNREEGKDWQFPVDPFVRQVAQLGFVPAVNASQGRGRLLRIEQANGPKFGVFEFSMRVPVLTWRDPATGKDVEVSQGYATRELTLKVCIDGVPCLWEQHSVVQAHFVTKNADAAGQGSTTTVQTITHSKEWKLAP